jgi:hydrogenase maturation protease
MRENSIAVIGIGHPDRGDDALGHLTIQELQTQLPKAVYTGSLLGDVADILDIFTNYNTVILIDALMTPQGKPGEIFRFSENAIFDDAKTCRTSTHAFDLAQTLALAQNLAILPSSLVIYGMQAIQFEQGQGICEAMQKNFTLFIKQIKQEVMEILHHA